MRRSSESCSRSANSPALAASFHLSQIARGVAEYRARDDEPLDFAGALVDVEDAAVAERSIERMIFGERFGAEQVDASLGNFSRRFAAGRFRDRRFHFRRDALLLE